MKSLTAFLFGSGWSMLWYALHYLLLWPLWGFYSYFRDFKPGAGPQGGEAIFLFLLMYGFVVIGIGIVNAVTVMGASDLVWWKRFVLWPAVLIVFPIVAVFLGVAMADSEADFSATGKLRIAITLPVLVLGYYGLNFWALASTRA